MPFAAAQVAQMQAGGVVRGSLAPMTVLTLAILALVLFPGPTPDPLGPGPLLMLAATVVVMGVSGTGRSEVASRLATRLGLPFIEADQLHGPSNLEKMA